MSRIVGKPDNKNADKHYREGSEEYNANELFSQGVYLFSAADKIREVCGLSFHFSVTLLCFFCVSTALRTLSGVFISRAHENMGLDNWERLNSTRLVVPEWYRIGVWGILA